MNIFKLWKTLVFQQLCKERVVEARGYSRQVESPQQGGAGQQFSGEGFVDQGEVAAPAHTEVETWKTVKQQ